MDGPATKAGDGDEMHVSKSTDHQQSQRVWSDRARSTLRHVFEEILEENGSSRPNRKASQQLDFFFYISYCFSNHLHIYI